MPTSKSTRPLTFELPLSLVKKIDSIRRDYDLGSTSEVVRLALDQFEPSSFQSACEPHVQMSVRLKENHRELLAEVSKDKKASVGEVVRAALERLPAKPKRINKSWGT